MLLYAMKQVERRRKYVRILEILLAQGWRRAKIIRIQKNVIKKGNGSVE